jgi:hypothetical protein
VLIFRREDAGLKPYMYFSKPVPRTPLHEGAGPLQVSMTEILDNMFVAVGRLRWIRGWYWRCSFRPEFQEVRLVWLYLILCMKISQCVKRYAEDTTIIVGGGVLEHV